MDEKKNGSIFTSSLGIKYPTFRDNSFKTGLQWLEGRRVDDGAEGFWRIHDNLYDLREFGMNHPGGPDWIRLTEGTDITEAFETHHLKGVAETLLPKFFVGKAAAPRNYPFTFHENGFYKTLKRAVVKKLPQLPKAPVERSKTLADLLIISYVGLAVFAAYYKSFSLGLLSGICLSLTAIAAHNFFHQKDNFRMYYFNFSFLQSRGWRISHALSHHLFTNTINDLEISSLEPFVNYLPSKKKPLLARYLPIIYSPILYCGIFFGELLKNLFQTLVLKKESSAILMLPVSVLLLMVVASGELLSPFAMFLWIQMMGSLHFGAVGLNAAHHHPDIFHDGDTARPKHEMDWGVYQLDAVMDRKDITGSHFLVLTNFGDHALHHLFPTVDHGLLEYLYPTFLEICEEFGVTWKLGSQADLVKGQFRQIAKSDPKSEPPKPMKVKT